MLGSLAGGGWTIFGIARYPSLSSTFCFSCESTINYQLTGLGYLFVVTFCKSKQGISIVALHEVLSIILVECIAPSVITRYDIQLYGMTLGEIRLVLHQTRHTEFFQAAEQVLNFLLIFGHGIGLIFQNGWAFVG